MRVRDMERGSGRKRQRARDGERVILKVSKPI